MSNCDGGFACLAREHIEGCYTGERHPDAVQYYDSDHTALVHELWRCETCEHEAEERRVVGIDHRNCLGGDECPTCGASWPDPRWEAALDVR
jgi:hypothetical protein